MCGFLGGPNKICTDMLTCSSYFWGVCMDCVRSIRFSIPGKYGNSDVEIYAFEVNGSLQFEVTLLDGHGKTPDLRGLFFNLNDFSKTAGLTFSNDFGAISGLRTGLIDDMG